MFSTCTVFMTIFVDNNEYNLREKDIQMKNVGQLKFCCIWHKIMRITICIANILEILPIYFVVSN